MCIVAYSIASIRERVENLRKIIPVILDQCDFIYVNLAGHNQYPDELLYNQTIVIEHIYAGSQVRLFDYNHNDGSDYYFTIDDDILYPPNYTEYMLAKMQQYRNKAICCVHGSDINLNKTKDYYKKKFTKKFHSQLSLDTDVMFPGVGTACFHKQSFTLHISDIKVDNMTDVYTGIFAAQQGLRVISVQREANWLQRLDEGGRTIWKSNPHSKIDELINKNKHILYGNTSFSCMG